MAVINAKVNLITDKLDLNAEYNKLTNIYNDITKEHPNFKIGDVIEFTSGYNDDIRYTSVIVAFDNKGAIFPFWDCWWSPIREGYTTNIIKIK